MSWMHKIDARNSFFKFCHINRISSKVSNNSTSCFFLCLTLIHRVLLTRKTSVLFFKNWLNSSTQDLTLLTS